LGAEHGTLGVQKLAADGVEHAGLDGIEQSMP